uniref:Uncharacterized protein n=1 Tax=Arundo donax TaxID=35708 RepID=A0A0A9F4M1_ARUDO
MSNRSDDLNCPRLRSPKKISASPRPRSKKAPASHPRAAGFEPPLPAPLLRGLRGRAVGSPGLGVWGLGFGGPEHDGGEGRRRAAGDGGAAAAAVAVSRHEEPHQR